MQRGPEPAEQTVAVLRVHRRVPSRVLRDRRQLRRERALTAHVARRAQPAEVAQEELLKVVVLLTARVGASVAKLVIESCAELRREAGRRGGLLVVRVRARGVLRGRRVGGNREPSPSPGRRAEKRERDGAGSGAQR